MTTNSSQIHFKGLIFDMDGTMINNMMIHHRAWQKKLADLGLVMELDDVRKNIHGVNTEILNRLFPGKYSEEEMAQIAWEKEQAYRDIYKGQVELLPGLTEFLQMAQTLNIPMGIGTAAPKENVDLILDELDMRSLFPVVVDSYQVKNGKPHPEVFQKVAKGLKIPLEDCLVFEDSPTGAGAANNGNANCLIITTTHEAREFDGIDKVAGFLEHYRSLTLTKSDQGHFQLQL